MRVTLLIVVLSGGVASGNVQGPWGGSSPSPVRAGPGLLPLGWSEHMDPSSGQPYYYNAADGTTTWDRPQNPLDIAATAAAAAANQIESSESPLEQQHQPQQQTRPALTDQKQPVQQQHGGPEDSSLFPATGTDGPAKQEPSGSDDETATKEKTGTVLEFGSAAVPVMVDSSSSSSSAQENDVSSSSSSSSQQQQQQQQQQQEDTSTASSPAGGASWDQQAQQQQDPRSSWNAGPPESSPQQQQQQHGGTAASPGGWGIPATTTETNQNPGWNLGGNPDRRPAFQNENVDPKRPTLVDDRRRGGMDGNPGSSPPNAGTASQSFGSPRNDDGPKQAWFSPQQQKQQQMYQRQDTAPMNYLPPQQQQQIPGAWRGGPGMQQGQPGYQQQLPPQQGAALLQQGPPPPQQQGPALPQQVPPHQQQQGPPRQNQGPPVLQPPGIPQRPQEAARFQQQQQRQQQQVPRIPETPPQRPPTPSGPYDRRVPAYGQAPYDGSSYNGQQSPQYYNPQQQQYPSPQQYGSQLYNGYGPYGSSTSQELVPRAEPLAGVRDSLGKTWQSVLGFGNRTKEVLSTTRDTVVTNARDAGQSITAKSTNWWGQARKTLGSVFESNEKGATDYSMTGIYGSGDGLQASRTPPPGYGGQPYGYPQQPQQQGPRQQNYPPQYYPGRPDMPPPSPGRSQQMPPPHQPPQQQQQPHQQQQQQQYPPPGSRYPPGYNPPNPRSDPPYAHQQHPPSQNRAGGPQQNQWGLGGPDPNVNKRGPPPGPQQQQILPMGRNNGPYGPGSPPLPGGQVPGTNKGGSGEEEKEQRLRDPWQHPGIGPDGY